MPDVADMLPTNEPTGDVRDGLSLTHNLTKTLVYDEEENYK